ncbi:MAG: sugar transferase [Candidatus Omnitrophica bacterium]|nr:sugar transferase [Candidatus Omnitrophota bacterium]
MIKSSYKMYPFYLLLDLVLIIFSFLNSYIIRYKPPIFNNMKFIYLQDYVFLFTLWSIFILFSLNRKGLYATDRSLTIPKETLGVFFGIFYASILMSAIIFFGHYKFFSRLVFMMCFLQLCFFLSGWRIIKRLLLRKLIQSGFHNINTLIVGTGDITKNILYEIRKNPWWGFKVVGLLDDQNKGEMVDVPVLGKFKDFTTVAKKYFIDEVIVTIPYEKKVISELIEQAKKLLLGIRVIPENLGDPERILSLTHLGIIPLLTYKERKYHPAELFFKRLFDFFVSLFLIILLSPLFVIIGILIKFNSEGSVFYVQKRIGLKGKEFNFYKFRSMIKEADEIKSELLEKNEVKDGIIFKIKKDPRITSLGLFLRSHSIDELPQLFNVLKGEMSLVGPRPPTKDEVERYNHVHMGRLSIRPGISGLSQVKGRSDLTFRKWVRWDLWYVNNWSFMLDLKILWLTIPAVFKGKGAY